MQSHEAMQQALLNESASRSWIILYSSTAAATFLVIRLKNQLNSHPVPAQTRSLVDRISCHQISCIFVAEMLHNLTINAANPTWHFAGHTGDIAADFSLTGRKHIVTCTCGSFICGPASQTKECRRPERWCAARTLSNEENALM